MNRILLFSLAVLGAAMPLVMDSALKGAALLGLAALSALLLWRASAAARHLVWLVAVVALLLVPLLSILLPGWRVLPQWAVAPSVTVQVPAGDFVNGPSMPHEAHTFEPTTTPATPALPPAFPETPALPEKHAAPPKLAQMTLPPPAIDAWRTVLPGFWMGGCALLLLRLLGAHWLLRKAARGCREAPVGILTESLASCSQHMGVCQPIRLLLDEKRIIPVVWGVWRPRLILPAEALEWDVRQLQSVFLHELAHIRRRDTLVQWITQIVCSLYWFNPLVWLAAWRLHVERERACDDMVLASGVKPSAYAGHLLHVASQLSPARWTAACGLAMARKSSLEGRLLAVLSDKLNRRGVTTALAAIALILGAGIAIPVAMLRAADDKWDPPRVAHIGGNDFSSYCVHDGKDTSFVIAYHGDFDSSTESSSNAKSCTWTDSGTITAKKPGIALSFHRTQDAPGTLSITTAPAEARDLSKPAPPPREFGQKEYDLAKGRVFLLTDNGIVRQLDIATPPVTDHEGAEKFAALIAAVPPQQREDIATKPEHKDARELYEVWQRYARTNGDIPGALIGELAAAVKVFIGYNPTWETVPTLNALLPRLDATHDWKSADAIALLDEVAAVKDSPMDMAAQRTTRHTIRNGEKLPEKFAGVAWGEAQPNGLRAAWVLEPGAAEQRIGAALKARLLVWNPGAVPVMLQVPTWYQGGVKATDAKGAEVEVSGISWTTIAQLFPCHLGPGEYIEIYTPGIGFGPRAGMGPWAGPRIGSSVLAKPGDDVTLTHSPVPLDGSEVGMSEDDPHVIGPGWWLAHIKTRLARELPLPADAVERTRLLDRAVRELFAAAPTAEETAAFVSDTTPDALDALIKRLAAREDVVSFSGKLPTASAKFRVLAADANADKQPRVVLGPGEYPLPSASARRGDATLKIVGRPVGDRRTNDAQLIFEATEFTGARPPDPHKLEVPDGWGTWAIVCRPSDGFFYLLHKGAVRKIDYSAPRNVTDTPATDLPTEFREEVKRQLGTAGVSAESQAEIFEKPTPPATTLAPKTGTSIPASDEAPLKPKHEYAQSLFRKWQTNARTDGKIPGALIGHVAREIDHFVKRYPQDEKAPQLAAVRPRLDASRDWTQAEVVALLDDITAISTAPVSWAATPMESSEAWTVRAGEPLPIELKSAAWGSPAKNGLRAAWLLEPRAEQYPLGTVLKARVLFHNTGTKPVVFKTETWHQDDPHTARDADGQAIPVGDTFYTGETPIATYRLEPGEYVAFRGHGIGIGAGEYREERSTGSIGAWIEAKERDEVSFSSQVDASREGWTGLDDPKDPMELWKLVVRQRVEREAPLPSIAADREQLIHRVTRDLFGKPPTAEEIAAFTADAAPDALAKLTLRLQARQRIEPFVGKLPTGEIKFRVIAVDPNAAKAPRTANAPGRYVLGDNVHLLVSQLTEGDKPRTNKARIAFLSPDPKVASPHKPYEIALPDGIGTYGIVWDRGAGVLWVMQKDLVRKYDFANPAQVQEMKIEPGTIINIPAHMQEALKQAFDLSGESVPQQKEKPTAAAAPKLPKLPDDAYARPGVHCQSFREEDAKRPGGELMEGAKESSLPEDRDKELVLGLRTASDAQWRIGGTAKVGLVVRNQSKSDVKFAFSDLLDSGLSIVAIDEAGKEHKADVARTPLGFVKRQQMLLPPGHVATVREFILRFDAEKRDAGDYHIAAFHLPPGNYTLRCKWSDASPEGAHEGEWSGELVSGEHKFTLAAAAPPPAAATEKPTTAGAKLAPETEAQFDWGDAVNGLRAAVVVRSPQPGAAPGIFLAVQNVSAAALRFTDSMAAKEQRKLYLSDSAGILMALTSGEPTKTAAVLPPRGVLFLPMFPEDLEKKGEAALIEGVRKDSLQTWRAVLNIENAPEDAWKGKLTTAETRGAVSADGPQPKTEAARALFKFWQRSARLNGDIPGGLLARLHDKVKEFIRNNTGDAAGDPYAKKMAPLEPRFGPAGDWKPADVVALLDDIAAVTTIPLKTTLLHQGEHTLRHGQPLPAVLEKADWGEALDGGLRMAFLLEPRAAEYHLGTEVKARILLHNSGKEAVAFITGSFHQPGHKAHLADGGELKLDGTTWFTRSLPQAYRLAPGEYIEVNTPGLGIGAHDKEHAEWSDVRAGSWILCKVGDEVTFLPGAVMLTSKETPIDPDWWLKFITERLEREAPVPLDTKEREYLLYRVVRELFGTAPSTTEGDAFAADKSPDALKNLAVLLTKHQYGTRCEGSISAGETKFRVLPPDPDADKKPRVAMNPGRYTLGESTTLVVTRRPDGRRIVNEAHLSYYSPPEDGIPAPHHKIELPDGYDTWAAGCVRGEKVLWLSQKGRLLKIDFTNFAKIQETRYEGDNTATAPIPAAIREALRAALTVPDAPKQIHEPLKPAAATPASPAASAPALEAPKTEKPKGAAVKLTQDALLGFWRGEMDDKSLMLSFHRPPVEKDVQLDIYEGEATIGVLATFTIAADGGSAAVVQQSVSGGMQFGTLIPVGEGKLKLELFGRQKGQMELVLTRDADAPATEPRQKEPRELFEMWKTTANADGTIPGTFIGALATEVRAYVKANPNLDSGMKLPKLLPRFVTSRDWTQAEAIKLLDDVAYYSTAPISARVAKCKLPSSPLWRSEVEFQDIPVRIEKWSEAKDGLRVGMRVVEADWRIGGKARVELWLHNAGGKAVTFKSTGSNRQDVGVAVAAIDAEGRKHWAENGNVRIYAGSMDCTLSVGYVAMAKTFEVTFDEPGNDVKAWFAPKFRDLKPGKYQLRCKWMDAHPTISQPGDWTGELTAPDMEFTLAAKGAAEAETPRAEKPKPEAPKGAAAKLPDSAYPKVGIPLGELDKRVEWSGVETQGLCLGIHIQDDAGWRVGGEVKAEVWVRNAGETDVKLSHSPRADVGLSIIAKGADGKEHFADITQFRGRPAYTHMLLPEGNVVKLKEFTIKLGVKNEGERVILDLPPGDYKLRAKWTDTTSHVVPEGEWTGDLTTGEADFKLAAANERDDHTYGGVGFPVDAFKFAMPPWGEVKDGLRTGIRIMGEARIGGRVQVELWIQNTSTKSVRFRESGDVDRGLAVIAEDSDGKIHPATLSSIRSYVPSRPYRLPPGYILKAKEFTLFLDSEANAHPRGLSASLHLPAGTYKLHTIWGDAKAKDVPEIEWKGEIESGEAELKIAPANAGADTTPAAKPAALLENLPDSAYAKSGVPIGEFDASAVTWSGEQDGLCLGMSVEEGAEWRIGGAVKVALWVCNPGEKDVKFQHSGRRDIGLRVLMKGADGKEHAADITQFLGKASARPVLLPAGHVFKAKEFSVVFLPPGGKAAGAESHFTLPAGGYKFRCELKLPGLTMAGADGKQRTPAEGEWTGTLKSGELDVKLVAADVPAAEAPKSEKPKPGAKTTPAADGYAKSGVLAAELGVPMTWSAEQNGLCLGTHIPGDADWRIGKEVKVELWIRNQGDKDAKLEFPARNDFGLSVLMTDKDGKEHAAGFTMLLLRHKFVKLLLPPGHAVKVREFTVVLAPPGANQQGQNKTFTLAPGEYRFHCEHHLMASVINGADGKPLKPAADVNIGILKSGEVDVKLVAADAPKTAGTKAEAPKADAPPAFLAPGVMPKRTHLFNDNYAAIAVQSEKDVNFVLIYDGALSSGITASSSEASGKWGFEGNVHLVDREKTKAAGKNVDKRVVAVKYTSDAPATLFLDGKAYNLAAQPRMTPMGALEATPGRVFLLRDEGEPFQTRRTSALRNEQDLASIGSFAVADRMSAELYAENRRIQEMEGWVLAWDTQVPLRHSGGHRFARMRIFPDGRVLSSPNGRMLRELKLSDGELSDLLRWLAEEQKVPAVKPKAAQPGDPKPAIAQEFDTWAGGMSFLQFKHDGQLHGMTVGSHLRNPGTGKELANPGAAAFKTIFERLAELEKKQCLRR